MQMQITQLLYIIVMSLGRRRVDTSDVFQMQFNKMLKRKKNRMETKRIAKFENVCILFFNLNDNLIL